MTVDEEEAVSDPDAMDEAEYWLCRAVCDAAIALTLTADGRFEEAALWATSACKAVEASEALMSDE